MQPNARQKSTRGLIIRLQPGESLKVNIKKLESMRSLCSTLGISMQRKYKTHIDREAMTVSITRIY